ncbi:MAG TPA: GNAT family N-acetyltransferase [Bryobacteraceae bacterium]
MEGVRHLVSRVAIEQLSAIHALSDLGFELIDGIQTYSRPIEGNEPIAADTRLFDAGDLDSVLEIARSSFVHDRFHCDSSLSEQVADRVNETWTRNCCLGRAADAVVIAEVESRPASYVACRVDPKNQLGTIILVATALWARGQGAAARATRGALHWFAAQDIRLVEVGTQLKNIPAARLYEGCGFRLSGVSLTFRKLI